LTSEADRRPADEDVVIRPASPEDFDAWIELYVAVATEGRWIGAETPVDREQRRQVFERFLLPGLHVMLVAEIAGRMRANLSLEVSHGIAELGMLVEAGWRGQGVGTRLMAAGLTWARTNGVHKVTLTVWPHNESAIALYRKFDFEVEGLLRRHYRRQNGELWDAIVMGLVFDWDSPGDPK
jgi:RimJ/RimL family protein N-acetyltransferase